MTTMGRIPAGQFVLAVCLLALGGSLARPASSETEPTLEDLVIVTEDHHACESVSVFSIGQDEPIYRALRFDVSPGRLAGTADLTTVLASSLNGIPSLSRLFGNPSDRRRWSTGPPEGNRIYQQGGALAVMPDGDTVLASVGFTARGERLHVGKYSLSSFSSELGVFAAGALVGDILPDPDGRRAHLLTADAEVVSIDVATMREVAARIRLETLEAPVSQMQASLTRDARYLVTNRPFTTSINVADLVDRTSWTLSLPHEKVGGSAPSAAGVAVNRAHVNAGLLAVHGYDHVLLFAFDDPRLPLAKVGRFPVSRPYNVAPYPSGPCPSVAWSATGSHVIAATSEGSAEFAVFEVRDCGRRIERTRYYTACSDQTANMPNDILTANGTLPLPTDFVPCPRPPTTAVVLPSTTTTSTAATPVTPSPTAGRVTITPMASATSAPFASPTPVPAPRYLPLALRETCTTKRQRADIVLVIDTSGSMAGSKLEDAKAAALMFADLTDFGPGRDQLALVGFSQQAELSQRLSRDLAAIRRAIAAMQTAPGTRMDRGLAVALSELQGIRREPANTPVVILMTDGLQSAEPAGSEPGAELRAAETVRRAGVRLYTIGLGSDVDAARLRVMAGDPSRYYFAPTSADLARIYAQVAQDIACPGQRFWGR